MSGIRVLVADGPSGGAVACSKRGLNVGDLAKLAPYLGLGLYHAWLSLSFYTTALFTGLEGATEIVNGVWTLGALGFALAMAVFLMPWSRGLCSWAVSYTHLTLPTIVGV